MPSPSKRKSKTVDIDKFFALMDRWADSWAGTADHVPVGEGLVAELRPFIHYLAQSGLTAKTVRRHLDNSWVIGGEIIRQIDCEPKLQKETPRKLLLDAIDIGEAPSVYDYSEEEQRSLDATARKLLRFLNDNAL
jgi:hypothetical protein